MKIQELIRNIIENFHYAVEVDGMVKTTINKLRALQVSVAYATHFQLFYNADGSDITREQLLTYLRSDKAIRAWLNDF